MSKTNAVRILESKNISFTLKSYEVDESDLSAVTVALKIGAEPEQVFKTLLTRGDKTGIIVFCIPGNYELNLKKAASVSGNKNIEMVKANEVLSLTGYLRGGCSPIGMKKSFPTFFDETANIFDKIYVSAGVRGSQIFLNPVDLKNLVNAEFADLV
ncbi:MAG TPA: Cys-tRNA(Pro) deacylase [Ignavibacteriaceae bacterium]|jgi:Cys-tRNA(Pro)/Cys-tRNA(Cys) deacylase|nr:Cys-tRNA(Pro) deacylase [Ignavibacteriaceae bacterium]